LSKTNQPNINYMRNLILSAIFVLSCFGGMAQYAPAAGKIGSTAIYKDSSAIVSWATLCSVVRGWQNIADHSAGKTTAGTESAVSGKADNNTISLGDGGTAIVQFAQAITNGPGPDFAVFENSFDDYFLELAFVEVSSDGQNYFRFPAHSLTQTDSQVVTFGKLKCEKIHNLAGKYRVGYGTPFDLEELKNTPGLDIMHISHIKIIDVVGSIDTLYGSKDSAGNMINDPYPTIFPSGGFDLDAVAVLHSATSLNNAVGMLDLKMYPNPVSDILNIDIANQADMEIVSMQGKLLLKRHLQAGINSVEVSMLSKGVYLLRLGSDKSFAVQPFIKQ